MNTKDMRDYAWAWFEYHAGQRLLAFRFFLVLLGVLVVGLGSALKDANLLLASAIASAAAFISLAFLVLEFRNERLVNVGRAALRKLEETEEFQQAPSELRLFHEDGGRNILISHKFWLRLIYLASIAVFLFLAFKPTTVMPASAGKGAQKTCGCVRLIITGGHPECHTSTRKQESA